MRDFIFLKNSAKCSKIFFNDLLYIEATDKYVRFVTIKQAYLVLGVLSYIERHLPPDQFCRIHRSFIVSFRHTVEFTTDAVLIAGKHLPLSKLYKANFYKRAGILQTSENKTSEFSTTGAKKPSKKLPSDYWY